MNDPLVSIIIPAFNSAKTLAASVESTLGQTEQDFEIIIVNDGSKDDTITVAESISVREPRVRVISQPNAGASAARNTGIRAAAGKYVALLDADDLWLPHKLETQLAILNAGRDGNAGWCGVYYVDNDLNVLNIRPCFDSKDIFLDILRFRNQSQWMSTLILERKVFDEVGFFDTDLAMIEDWEFMLRISKHCDLKNIEAPLTLYREYPGNRSKDWGEHIKPGLTILDRVFNDPTRPAHIDQQRASIYSAFYAMLSGGAYASRDLIAALKWGVKAILTHPGALAYIVALPFRRFKRNSSRRDVTPEHQIMIDKMKVKNSDV